MRAVSLLCIPPVFHHPSATWGFDLATQIVRRIVDDVLGKERKSMRDIMGALVVKVRCARCAHCACMNLESLNLGLGRCHSGCWCD